jgi:hypothetical protein
VSPWLTALFSLVSALVVAVVTSLLTVRLALRRFYSEKWWERKAAAYAVIMESMHHVREHADTHLAHETPGQLPLPPGGEEKLKRQLEHSMANLRMHRDVGSLVICDEAIAAINALFGELDESVRVGVEETFLEYLDYRIGALDRSLEEMRRIAREDLSLAPLGPRHHWHRLLRYLSIR